MDWPYPPSERRQSRLPGGCYNGVVIIDAHTHMFPPEIVERRDAYAERDAGFAALYADPKARLATAEDLVASLVSSGVDAAVALNFGWRDAGLCTSTNDYILDAARRYPGRIIPFCMVQPADGPSAARELERCVAAGARGIGEMRPEEQGYDLDDRALVAPLVEAAGSLRVPLLLHASEPVGHLYPGKGTLTPERLLRFVEAFPQATIVLAHWGGGLPFYALMPEVARSLANVYVDTAASSLLYRWEVVEVVAQAFGSERILFGSDFPLLGQGPSVRALQARPLSAEAIGGILGANAARLLGVSGRGPD